MVLLDPVGSICQDELAYWPRALPVEVDRLAPVVRVPICEVRLGEPLEVVAVGAQVVVDNVEDDAETHRMRPVHEAAEVVRPPVEPRRCEEVHPVVAQPNRPGKSATG